MFKIRYFIAGIFLLLALHGNGQDLASKINSKAIDTKDKSTLYKKDGKVFLYGQQTNDAETQKGKLACAQVVSIVLREAGLNIPVQLGVNGIETQLSKWQKITKVSDLKPGDVVVWTSIFKGNKDCTCTGGGTCHVGIYTEKGFFHNNPLSDCPTFNGIGLSMGYKFKVAYRCLQ
jgi:hypothetical protein